MAEESSGDKTEAPTPRRRTEAREQGTIARSRDLTAAVLLLGIMVLLKWYGPRLVTALKTLMAEMLCAQAMQDVTTASLSMALLRAVVMLGVAMAPLFVGVLVLAILANLLQVGFFFNPARLQPNFAALNPLGGLGRIFAGGQNFVQMGMNLVKMLLVAAVAYSAVHGRIGQIISVQQLSFLQIFGLGSELVYSIALRIGIFLLILAIFDYAYQRYRIEQELKMSKEEVKEEMRRMDGDPKIKGRRRQVAQQIALQRMKKAVPTADVVVTNPTEFAVALKYDAETMHAPRVVAKGRGLIAQRIREIAIANGIPILERKPLARALYKLVHVGQEIPEQFYTAVAEILAYVYELSGKNKRSRETLVKAG